MTKLIFVCTMELVISYLKKENVMNREGRIRISLDIPTELGKRIRRIAKKRNITLTRVLIRALSIYAMNEEKFE